MPDWSNYEIVEEPQTDWSQFEVVEESTRPTATAETAPDTIQEYDPSLRQRLRTSAVGRALLGPTTEEREVMAEVPVSPMDLVHKGFEFASVPRQIADPIKKFTDPIADLLPAPVAGAVTGIRDLALDLPLAAGAVSLGKKAALPLLGVFGGEFAATLPEQLKAIEDAPDTKEGIKQSTQTFATGALTLLGIGHESARIRADRLAGKPTPPPAIEIPPIAAEALPKSVEALKKIEPAPTGKESLQVEEPPITDVVPRGTEHQTAVEGLPTVEIPISELSLSADVPQFKAGANERGVIEPISGSFDRRGVAPIQVWRRADGSLEIISGRHRFDLAQRMGEKTIPAQIHDEATGFNAQTAARLDAELNIRDEQGSVGDYANYFKNSDISETEANTRGLLARAKGKAGFSIAKGASDDLFALHQAGRLSDAQADAISRAAPGYPALQAVGIKSALDGKSAELSADLIRFARQRVSQRKASGQQQDLFSFDDSAIKEMEAQARIAGEERRQIKEQINAIKGASKKPDLARKLGVNIDDPEGVSKRVSELEARLELLRSHPELAGTLPKTTPTETVPTLRQGEKQGDIFAKQSEELTLAGEKGVDYELRQKEQSQRQESALEAQRIVDQNQTKMVGMGGAVPSEFARGQGSPTAAKYKLIDKERQERGLEPLTKPQGIEDQAVLDRAMSEIDRDPSMPERLVSDLNKNPRVIEDWQNHVLVLRKIELRDMYEKSAREAAEAFDNGRLLDMEEANARTNDWSNKLTELEEASRVSGSARGRALRSLQVMVNEDFSLASLELQKRAANDGAPITVEQRIEITEIAKEYQKTIAAYEKRLAESQAKTSELEAARAIAEIQLQSAKSTSLSPEILKVAERIVSGWEKEAQSAEVRLNKLLGRTNIGADRAIIVELAKIGRARLGRVGIDFAKWSLEMTAKFGDAVTPFLKDAWAESQRLFDKEDAVKTVQRRKANIEDKKAAAVEAIKSSEGKKPNIGAEANKLARHYYESGIHERDPLIDAVHSAIKEALPEITRRETMDAISGYGDYKRLTKDEISVGLRDLRGQMQQIGKLQDMQAGEAPKKTGVERRTPSAEESRLIKQVEESKRRGGYRVTDPETQLRSALQSIRTRLENQIRDLQHEIDTKTKIVPQRTKPPTSPEIEALAVRRDALKQERDALFGKTKTEMTDAQRIAMAMRAVERSIADYETRLKAGDISTRKRLYKTPETPELVSARSKRDALKEQLQELRDLANPQKTPEQRALQSFKTRTANKIADFQDRLAKGNFETRKRTPTPLDKEATSLKFKLDTIKRDWNEALLKDKLSKRTKVEKVFAAGLEGINLSRALVTSSEFSAVLRQGLFIVTSNPARLPGAMADMFRAFRSKEKAHRAMEEIRNREDYQDFQQSGLYIAEEGGRLAQMEEAYMSRWATKIPIVAGSQRAYVAFLNRLRADSFSALKRSYTNVKTYNPEAGKIFAGAINAWTGRGSLGRNEAALVGLNTVFFAPRFVASRFQTILGLPILKAAMSKDFTTTRLIAKEYAKFLMGSAVIYALGSSAGAKIETDSNSSDFGKFVWGKVRLDPMGGLIQSTVLLSRLISGKTKDLSGRVTPIRGKVPYGKPGAAEITGKFLRSKLAPVPGALLDVFSGENIIGDPVTPLDVGKRLVVPISYGDILPAMKELGMPEGTALGVISLFGMGLEVHESNEEPEKEVHPQ